MEHQTRCIISSKDYHCILDILYKDIPERITSVTNEVNVTKAKVPDLSNVSIINNVYNHLHALNDKGVDLSLLVVCLTDITELMHITTTFKVRFVITYNLNLGSVHYWYIDRAKHDNNLIHQIKKLNYNEFYKMVLSAHYHESKLTSDKGE